MQDKLGNKYPLVSIFCFCKNRVKTIRRCIDSIVAQDYPNIEIIVQDGASTDGTLEILESYGDKIDLVSEPDAGAGDAMFRALGRISGEFFGSCLSDEELLPHAVSWAVENLRKYPEAAAIYGDVCITDIDGNITREKYAPPQWDYEKYFCSETTPPFCTSFFRRSCYEAHGLHEHTGGGEFDFWIRLGARFPIRHVPGLVAKYALHPEALGFQAHLCPERFAARKTAIERLCNDPETPEHIRLLRDKAIASLDPALVISYCHIGSWDLAKKHAPDAFKKAGNQEILRSIAGRFYNHGVELQRNGELEEALEYFDLLVKCNVVGSNLNYQRAIILVKFGRINEAAKASYEELKLQPDHRGAKAIIRLAQSCPEGTVQSHNDKLAEELFKTGFQYLRQANAQEAVKHLDKAALNCPTLPNLHFALATAHTQLADLNSAKKACEAELVLQPEHDGAKRLLERIEKAMGYTHAANRSSIKSAFMLKTALQPVEHHTHIDSVHSSLTKSSGEHLSDAVCFGAIGRCSSDNADFPNIVKGQNPLKMQTIGTKYGGWAVDLDLIPSGSTVISAGVGEDISFDLGLISLKNCKVIGIDPTEKAKKYIEKNKNENFEFVQKALCAESNKKIKIYKSNNPDWVSESITPSHHTVNPLEFYEAQTISLHELLQKYQNVSVLKMDIEGAEYEVLNSINKLDIPQVCVEFHHFCTDFTIDDTLNCIERLKDMGYVVAHSIQERETTKEATFVHRKCLCGRSTPEIVRSVSTPAVSDWTESQIDLFDEEPCEVIQARKLLKSYFNKRLKDIWYRPDHPVWFDHEIDYHLWPENMFWVERGVFGRIAMRPGCRVLDLCCGDGYYSDVWYSTIAASIDACDNDRDALRFALLKHANPKVEYHYINLLDTPFPNSKYDVVTWFGAIEHFSEEQIVFLLRKIRDALEDGGILVGSTPLFEAREVAEKSHANRQHDREFINSEDLERVLRKVFKKVQSFTSIYSKRTICHFRMTKVNWGSQK